MQSKLNPAFSGVNRILVRGVNWVGDSILTYPAVQKLKSLFPDSHLTILIPSHLVDLWKTFPNVDEIIPFQKRRGIGSIWEDINLGQSLMERKFDLALILPRSFRSAFHIFMARIPIRIGYKAQGRSLFLTHGIPRKKEVLHTHRIRYYQELTDSIGQTDEAPSPRIFLREEDRKSAEEMVRNKGLFDGRLLIGMNPGATYGQAKCWYPKRFGELGERIIQKWNATILLFGKEEEKPIAKEILVHLREGAIDLTGKTRLLQLAAFLERCQLLVTNDTGTMHMAAAVGTPVLALFGPTDPSITGPWGDGHIVTRKDVACSPCLKRICPTDHRCMELITVDEVEEAVDRKLKELNYER